MLARDAYTIDDRSESEHGPDGVAPSPRPYRGANGSPLTTSMASGGMRNASSGPASLPPVTRGRKAASTFQQRRPWVSASSSTTLEASITRQAFAPLPVDANIHKGVLRYLSRTTRLEEKATHEQIRREVADHIRARTEAQEAHQRAIRTDFSGLQRHAQTSEEITYTINSINKLLEKLKDDVAVEQYREPIEPITAQKRRLDDDEEEGANEILVLRANAAALATREDGLSEDDYSVDPPLPAVEVSEDLRENAADRRSNTQNSGLGGGSGATAASGGGGGAKRRVPRTKSAKVREAARLLAKNTAEADDARLEAEGGSSHGMSERGEGGTPTGTDGRASTAIGSIAGGASPSPTYSAEPPSRMGQSAAMVDGSLAIGRTDTNTTADGSNTSGQQQQQQSPTNATPEREPQESQTMRAITSGILTSLRKAHYSLHMARRLMQDNPQWFNSSIISRRVNTYAIRANYHGRKVHVWAALMRSTIFLLASSTNHESADATKDIKEANRRYKIILDHERALGARAEQQARRAAEIAGEISKLKGDHGEADGKMMTSQHVYSDPDIAETLLLLRMLQPIERLRPHIHEVRQWLAVQDALGKPSASSAAPSAASGGMSTSASAGSTPAVGIAGDPNDPHSGDETSAAASASASLSATGTTTSVGHLPTRPAGSRRVSVLPGGPLGLGVRHGSFNFGPKRGSNAGMTIAGGNGGAVEAEGGTKE